jgi:complement component 1 Q subcomponent-binding protein
MFSIADIQSAEEDPEYEQEEGEGAEDQPLHSYPVRASFSITKVWLHVERFLP